MKKQSAIVTLLSAMLLLAAHLAGTYLHWYDTHLNYDKMLHFLGGFFVFFVFVTKIFQHNKLRFSGRQLLVLILFVFFVGILWEVFEYVVQHFTGFQLATFSDSIGDLIFDNLGAVTAALLLYFVQDAKKGYNIPNAER